MSVHIWVSRQHETIQIKCLLPSKPTSLKCDLKKCFACWVLNMICHWPRGQPSVQVIHHPSNHRGCLVGTFQRLVLAVFQRNRIQEILSQTGSYRIRSRSFYQDSGAPYMTLIVSFCLKRSSCSIQIFCSIEAPVKLCM